MDRYRHGKELFYLASRSLAIGQAGIKQRLFDAALQLVGLRIEDEIPPDCRKEFTLIWRALTRIEDERNGALAATIQQMDEEEASKFAERIFDLYGKVLHGSSL